MAKIPTLLQALGEAAAMDPRQLEDRLSRAGERRSYAMPADEPLHSKIPPPPHPEYLNVVAADGSQVYPDRHAPAQFFLINIGSIQIACGRATPPATLSSPRIFCEDQDLYGDRDRPIAPALIDGMRDLAEMGELARLAEASPKEPTLALLDNGLLLWLALQVRDQSRKEVEAVLKAFLANLGRLQRAGPRNCSGGPTPNDRPWNACSAGSS
jgi:hypothetical protein